MPFTLIRGSFHVAGYSPDGDSIRFAPDDLGLLARLNSFPARINGRNHVQLRIEAIDTLETHYSTSGGTLHQPFVPAFQAATALLDFTGIGDVVWNTNRTNILTAHDGTRGYILTRAVEKYGRPIAFVYAGEPEQPDGAEITLQAEGLDGSYNLFALRQGFAYPTFYTGLFHDLRDALSTAAQEARAAKRGLYAIDRTTSGVNADSLQELTEEAAILPKLFRRLVDYLTERGTVEGFKEAMELSQEPVLDLRTRNFTHFDTFIEQDGAHVRLTREPEELVFDEMPTRPVNNFLDLVEDGVLPV